MQFYQVFNDPTPFVKDARCCLIIPQHNADVYFLINNFNLTMLNCGLMFMNPEVMVALYCMAEVPIMMCPKNSSRLVFRAVYNNYYYKVEIVNNQISAAYGVLELCAKSVCVHATPDQKQAKDKPYFCEKCQGEEFPKFSEACRDDSLHNLFACIRVQYNPLDDKFSEVKRSQDSALVKTCEIVQKLGGKIWYREITGSIVLELLQFSQFAQTHAAKLAKLDSLQNKKISQQSIGIAKVILLQLFWRSKCSAALQRQLVDIVVGIGNQKRPNEFVQLVYDLYRENYFK